MSATKKISIIGGTLWGNRGAEAMLETTIGEMRKRCPQAEFGIFSYYAPKDRELITDSTIHVFSSKPTKLVGRHFPWSVLQGFFLLFGIKLPLPADMAFLRDSDVLLDIGGITYNDDRLKYLPFNVLTNLPAMLMRTPVVKLAQAMGPFHHPLNRMVSKFMLSRCKLVVARGAKTAEHLKDLKLNPARWITAADIAFSFDPAEALTCENEEKVDALVNQLCSARQRIAVSPSVLVYNKKGESYLDLLTRMIETLDQEGMQFVVFPNASREGLQDTHNNDLVAVDALRTLAQQKLPAELLTRIAWVDYDINNASIRRLTCQADLLITSRFHAMISGLVCTTPTFVIGWSHKYLETLAGFGLESAAMDYNAAPEKILAAVREMTLQLPQIKAQISERLLENQNSSAAQFDHLKDVLQWKN